MFGLTAEKLLIAGVIAAVLLGPHRLPHYAHKLGELVRMMRAYVDAARARAEAEAGVSLQRSEWETLDPRRYDPRRIIREALSAEEREEVHASDGAPTVHQTSPEADAPPRAHVAAEADAASQDGTPMAKPRYLVTGDSGHPRRILVTPEGAQALTGEIPS